MLARALATYVLGALLIAFTVWWIGLGQALDSLERRARSDLALAVDRLVGQLERYREIGVVLAGDPRLQNPDAEPEALHRVLQRSSDLAAALDIVLLDRDRTPVARAEKVPDGDWFREPFIARALDGSVATYHAISEGQGRRAFYIAVPVFSDPGPVARVLVVVVDLERLEGQIRGSTPAVLFTDALGVTFYSNRSELLLMHRGTALRDETANFSDVPLIPFLTHRVRQVHGHELWSVSGSRYVPSLALHVGRDIRVIGFRAEVLADARPAYVTAGFQAAAAGAICLFLGALLLIAALRRRILARANAKLETRVAERTGELSRSNAALRTEIKEREDAEQALKRAQDDLIQVGKLSALGKMSAGISHELNQPLMAIQSFAENGLRFLELGKSEKSAENLGRIAELASRMARIIKNLKAFARQESEPAANVDLCAAVRAAVGISETRLAGDAVRVDVDLPDHPVWVHGGEVRLQQVVLNLISNAVDAMAGQSEKRLHVTVADGAHPKVAVSDIGPGIEDVGRIFEPFYTTKSVGDGDGTGLGLSISYGLVQSFGGDIRGENLSPRGARFTVTLRKWAQEDAA